jgi:hypothetical protein
MSLTKKDLSEIEKLINKTVFSAFEQLLIPYVDATNKELKEEIRDDMAIGFKSLKSEIREEIQELRGDMNEGFAQVHARIDDAIALNGRYYEDCATKKEHKRLEKRVKKLELA